MLHGEVISFINLQYVLVLAYFIAERKPWIRYATYLASNAQMLTSSAKYIPFICKKRMVYIATFQYIPSTRTFAKGMSK
jgi:hypothetical protein